MKRPRHSFWNRSSSPSVRGAEPLFAANRVFSGYFEPQGLPEGVLLSRTDPVFTMGSCFAREIEGALRKRRLKVLSTDIALLARHDFTDDAGRIRLGFFNRYNLPSMDLELRKAVGAAEFDIERDLAFEGADGIVEDLHYTTMLPRRDRAGMVARRRVAAEIASRFTRARLIVITLGLTEGFFHLPSGMYCNAAPGTALVRRPEDFEYRVIGIDENRAALASIYDCIKRHHETGQFNLVVTVSPVPLATTFSGQDVVIANSRSKATLRAIAEEFCQAHDDAMYFPSYEIAMYSDPAKAWREDMMHVQPACVEHIVTTFIGRYVDQGPGLVAEAEADSERVDWA